MVYNMTYNSTDIITELQRLEVLDDNQRLSKKSVGILLKHPLLIEQITSHTSFITGPLKTSLRERIYCIKNNITQQKKCIMCNAPITFRTTGVAVGYSDTCSYTCGIKNPNRIIKRKDTNIQKYGTPIPQQTDKVKNKQKTTNLQKYGRVHKNQKHIIPMNYSMLTNKEWLYEQHYINRRTLSDIATELNVDVSTVQRNLNKLGYNTKHFFVSTGETQICDYLQELSVEVEVNTRNIIPPYELDIFLPDHNIAIEYCGLYWHSEQQGKNKHYHQNKYEMCKQRGIRLLTIFEDEWKQRQDIIKEKLNILVNCDTRQRLYGRSCKIGLVSTSDKQIFLNKYHVQGDGPSSINIGLNYNYNLVSCMSFIKQQNGVYVLNRYASSSLILGGFTKLLKYFITTYTPSSIVTFADLRWSSGDLYDKTGFTPISIIPPDYYYSPDGHHRYHKFNYRRKYLPKLLKSYDEQLSERVNCDLNGVLRIWDCGKIKYVLM